MKHTVANIFLFILLSICCIAQTKPAAPRSASPKPTSSAARSGGSKIAVINMQAAISGTNEGQRDLGALYKKYEPRRAALEKLNNEVENLKKQLTSEGEKMTPAARQELTNSIENKTKSLQRSAEDFQSEVAQQEDEIGQRILKKLAPVMSKYVNDNGYGLVLDISAPWPRGPVILASRAMDITKPVVDAYNAQSGIAAPTPAKPATPAAPPAKQ